MITHIHLKNFKGLVDEPFEIAPLTLLAGANGLGKSSIIQSLLLLRQSYDFTYLQNQNKVFLGFKDTALTNLETAEDLCNNKADSKIITISIETDNDTFNWEIDASEVNDTSLPFSNRVNGSYSNEALFKESFLYLT